MARFLDANAQGFETKFAELLADFDLVGLQEADAGSLRSGFLNQTQYLAEAAGFPYWSHQPNRKIAQFAASSNGLLTRMKPDAVFDYPLPGSIPGRGALWARFGSGDGELIVVPQQGRLKISTDMGVVDVEPQEVAVIPRGVRFRVKIQ